MEKYRLAPVCLACLTLMFFESAFGICLGCKVYNLFFRERARLCPGDACEAHTGQDIQAISLTQIGVAMLFLGLLGFIAPRLSPAASAPAAIGATPTPAASNDECTPPDWAVQMGHADRWKLHHNCK